MSNIAQKFSMPTNGLSLKPCDKLPPGRLLHSDNVAPRIFFVTLPGGGKTFFAAFSRAMDLREIRRLQAPPEHARLYLRKR